jgi:predicted transcriptional regulator
MVETEGRQVEEVRRRLASRTGDTVSNERVLAWLESWGLNAELPPPKCE